MRQVRMRIALVSGLLLSAVAVWFWLSASRTNYASACREALKRRNWQQLAELSQAWSESEPTNVTAWLHRAEAAQNQDDFANACRFLERIPPDTETGQRALESRIELQFRLLNRPQDAAESCRLLLQHDPNSSLAQQRLIFYYAFTLQRRQLIDQIHDAVARQNEPREAYTYLFFADSLRLSNAGNQIALWLQGDPESELLTVAQALHIAESLEGSIPRDDPDYLATIKEAMIRRDRTLNALLTKYPHNLELLAYFMRRAVEEGDVDRVKELLLQAPAEAEYDNRCWRYRGWVFQSFDKLDEAEAAYRQALKLHSLDWGTRPYLAGLLRRQGKLAEAGRMEELVKQSGRLRRAMLEQQSVASTAPDVLRDLVEYAAACQDHLIADSLKSQMERYNASRGPRP